MSWKNTEKSWLTAGSLALLLGSAPGFAQQECEQIRKNCLDHCHYAPQHQWSSGFKCKRECTKQVDACRRGIRGYPPAYSYGSRSGYGYGGAPAQRGAYGGYPAGTSDQRGGSYGYGAGEVRPRGYGGYPAAAPVQQQPPAPRGYGAPVAGGERPFVGP